MKSFNGSGQLTYTWALSYSSGNLTKAIASKGSTVETIIDLEYENELGNPKLWMFLDPLNQVVKINYPVPPYHGKLSKNLIKKFLYTYIDVSGVYRTQDFSFNYAKDENGNIVEMNEKRFYSYYQNGVFLKNGRPTYDVYKFDYACK